MIKTLISYEWAIEDKLGLQYLSGSNKHGYYKWKVHKVGTLAKSLKLEIPAHLIINTTIIWMLNGRNNK